MELEEDMTVRKNFKRVLSGVLAGVLVIQSPVVALADSEKVVTLGADLTEAEKAAMMQYFGVSENEVTIIEVNNQEERAYLEGIATESEIGTRTYSCAYIMPTNNGEINVRTAHLTWVSTSMIANTLVTAGIDSCDVIAAAPRDVSGTGALTGIIKAYEKVTDEELDAEKTELAMEELYETADLGAEIGQDEASAIMNEVKQQVLKDEVTDVGDVEEIVNEVAEYYDVNLTEEQTGKVSALMSDIASQDYDYDSIKGTMEGLQDKLVDSFENIDESFLENSEGGGILAAIGDFFAGIFKAIGNFFANLFGGSDDDAEEQKEESILNNVDDSALGIEPTDEAASQEQTESQDSSTDTSRDSSTSDTTTQENTDTTEQSDSFTVDENSNVVPEDSGTNESNTDTTAESSSITTTDVDTAVEQSSTDLSLDIQ